MHDEIRHESYDNPSLLPESNWNLDQPEPPGEDEPPERLDQWKLPSGLIGKPVFDFDREYTYLASHPRRGTSNPPITLGLEWGWPPAPSPTLGPSSFLRKVHKRI